METTITERESLKIISEMIETSKNNIRDNGFFYLLWGWLVFAASLIHFFLLFTGYKHPYIAWPVLMFSGALISVIAGIRMGKKAKVISHIDKTIIFLWWGFFFTIMVILFIASTGHLAWEISTPLIIALYGMGTFVSGGALKFRPLIIGRIACWIIAIIASFTEYSFVLLLTALSVVIAYLIPGYMLKARS
ncbi:MAG: hypothetical protein JXA03_16635 [Bacteroidales bacterium]|nr:hypothetical protein [Bacteroidales bacterium]